MFNYDLWKTEYTELLFIFCLFAKFHFQNLKNSHNFRDIQLIWKTTAVKFFLAVWLMYGNFKNRGSWRNKCNKILLDTKYSALKRVCKVHIICFFFLHTTYIWYETAQKNNILKPVFVFNICLNIFMLFL